MRKRELRFQSVQEFAQALRPLLPELVALQLLPAEDGLADGLEEQVHAFFGLLLGDVQLLGDLVGQVRFNHGAPPFWFPSWGP